jgi:hypothetical protein
MLPIDSKIIAVDFDGTCVRHEYPNVGRDLPNAVSVLKELVTNGHKLVLFTMRSDKYLADAVNWFNQYGIPLHGVNEEPNQKDWTKSPKAFANVYIDDAALGCPLIQPMLGARPYVDWHGVRNLLMDKGVLPDDRT